MNSVRSRVVQTWLSSRQKRSSFATVRGAFNDNDNDNDIVKAAAAIKANTSLSIVASAAVRIGTAVKLPLLQKDYIGQFYFEKACGGGGGGGAVACMRHLLLVLIAWQSVIAIVDTNKFG